MRVANAHGLNFVILDQQQILDRSADEIFQSVERLLERFLGLGLRHETKRSLVARGLAILIHRDDVDRNMARGQIHFQPVQHAPAIEVRQMDIERHGRRLQLARQSQCVGSALGDDSFESLSWAISSRMRL